MRAKVKGTSKVPRLCVFRSASHIYVQLIDDEKGKTILSSSDLELKKSQVPRSPDGQANSKSRTNPKSKIQKEEDKGIIRTGKIASAYEVGRMIAEKAKEKKISKVVFDRGGYKYHGRVKAAAEGAREGGLIL